MLRVSRDVRQRGKFLQYIVESWMRPRRSGESWIADVGSEFYLIALTHKGSYYEADWRFAPEGVEYQSDATEWDVGLIETGTIESVCEAVDEFIRGVLQEEGKDPNNYC